MPAALTGAVTTYGDNQATLVATAPTHANGDQLLAITYSDSDGTLAGMTASGWTLISDSGSPGVGPGTAGSAGHMKLWNRMGTGASTYSFGFSTGSAIFVWMARISGYNTITPWQNTGTYSHPAAASTTSLVAPSITSMGTGLLVSVWTLLSPGTAATITAPAGMTGTSTGDTIPYVRSLIATQSMSAGTTGTRTATASSAGNTAAQGYLTMSFMVSDASSAQSAAGTSAVVVNASGNARKTRPANGTSPIVVNASGNPAKEAPQAAGASPIVISASGAPTRVPLTFQASGASPIVVNASGAPGLLKPKLETLQDNFATADTVKWANIGGTNPGVSGGQLVITPGTDYPSITTMIDYSLPESYGFVELVEMPPAGNGTIQAWPLQLRLDSSNQVQFIHTNGNLLAEVLTAGAYTTLVNVPYSPTDHRWLRIRAAGGTVYWDRSADGITWVNMTSAAVAWSLNDLLVYIGAGYYGTEPTPGVMRLDNFNVGVAPVYPAAGTSPIVISASGAARPLYGASGTSPVVVGAAGTVTSRRGASGTSPIVLGAVGDATLQQAPQAAGRSDIVIGAAGTISQRAATAGSSPIVITSLGAADRLPAIRGQAPIVIAATGDVSVPVLGVSGTAPIVIGASGDPGGRLRAAGTSPIVIGASGLAGFSRIAAGTSAIVLGASGNPIVFGSPERGEVVEALFDEDEVLEGGRVTYYSFDLLDAQENYIGQLEGVTGGSVSIDAYASVKSTGSIDVVTTQQYLELAASTPTVTSTTGTTANTPTGETAVATSNVETWYSGAYIDHDAAALAAMGTWRGRPMDTAVVFPTRTSGQVQNPWYLDSQYSGGVPVVTVALPMCYDGGSVTADNLTSDFNTLASAYNADGRIFILRLGWEYNLPNWSWGVTDSNVSTWKSKFNQYAAIFKNALGSRGLIALNPNIGKWQSGYSGTMDTFISGLNFDLIGPDAYDCYPGMTSEANIAEQYNGTGPGNYGLTYWANKARTLGKGLICPEWGVSSGTQWAGNTGLDNPWYISVMKTWFDSNADIMFMDGYFNDPQSYIYSEIFSPDPSVTVHNPNAGTRYQKLFSASASAWPSTAAQVSGVSVGDTFVLQNAQGATLDAGTYTVVHVDQAGFGLQDFYFTPTPTVLVLTGFTAVFVTPGSTTGGGTVVVSAPSWLNVRIRPMIRIARLGGGDDDEGQLVPAGVYTVAAPQEKWEGSNLTRTLELTDKLGILDQDIASGSTTSITAYTAAAGANIIALVKTLIGQTGEAYPAIQPSSKVLSAALVWDIGTTRLKIINDLLDAAGYFSLYCDGWGQYRADPYVAPAARPPVYSSLEPFSNGERSLMDPSWTRDRDFYSVPNRYLVVGQGDGDAPALTSVATNLDPNSPYSYANRGRWITAVEVGVEAVDQASLDTIARNRLSTAMSVTEEFTLEHAFLPDLHVNSVVRFVNPDAGLNTSCYVVTTTIPFDPTELCQTTMRVVGGATTS